MNPKAFVLRHKVGILGILGALIFAAIISLMYKPWQNKGESVASQTSRAPDSAQQVMINPAGQTTTIQDEIGKLQGLYSQAPDSSPLKIRLLFAMGETYVKYGQIEPAITSFEQVLGLSPNDKRSHYYLGELYLAKGDTVQAVSNWTRYLELDPTSYIRESIEKFLNR